MIYHTLTMTTSFVKIYFKNFGLLLTKCCAPFIDTVSVHTSHDNLNIEFYTRDEYDIHKARIKFVPLTLKHDATI